MHSTNRSGCSYCGASNLSKSDDMRFLAILNGKIFPNHLERILVKFIQFDHIFDTVASCKAFSMSANSRNTTYEK